MVLPPGYEQKSAADKLDVLWKNLKEQEFDPAALDAPKPIDPDPLVSGNLLNPAFTHVTFENASDEMPVGRVKLIHTYGSVAKVELQLAPEAGAKTRFTGMFAATSVGLVRVSLGRQSVASFSPGAAIKLLIDGRQSVNMMAMSSFDGQDADRNIFRKVFSNILPFPQHPGQIVLDGGFAVSIATLHSFPSLNPADRPENPRTLPLLDAAKVNPDGTPVADAVEPYQMFFTPTPGVTALYEKVMKKDMRAASASIPAGTVLWTISAKATQETPDGEAEHLGKVVTTSEFVSSEYGDESLFFQHMQHRRV